MRFNRFRSFLAAMCLLALCASPAGAQATDTDTDGMPDAWESFFGLDPNSAADATLDADGDGLTNLQEFQAGRHPVGRFARFFAEGSTGYFDTSLAVLNLSATDTAHVSIALLNESGEVETQQITLAPRARQSVSLNTMLGTAAAVSIIVESDVAIAADRAMTWGPSGVGLSLDSGAPAPATTWYFAEGATGPFLLYYLFENPGATPANVTVRYLREGDTPISRTRTLPPHSRTTVFVNADDPGVATASLGAVVTADVPILAERAMYVQANGTFAGGSASSGSPSLSTQWYFGEGATGPFFHAFLSLLNPGPTAATATVTYHMSDGSTASKAYDVPAEDRRTIYFNGEADSDATLAALANGPVWFTVSSTQPIVGERAMWWSTWPWYEGHAAVGSTTSDVAWGVAEGRHGGPENDQTYVLVGNAAGTDGQVRVTLIPDGAAPQTRDLTIAAGARLTIGVGELFGLTGATTFSVTVESIGATPVPLVVDYARYRSVNGIPFSGGGAAPAVPLLPGDPAPRVTATTPAAGATGASNTNDIVVTFNEPVNAAAGAFTLACPSGTPIALTVVTASPASQFTLDPAVALPALTTCTLTVHAAAITDVDTDDPPDSMTADAVVTFTTAVDDSPTVSSTTPAAGATQVGLAANLAITFSEPVNVTGSWFQIVCASSGTRNPGNTVVTGGPTTFTINPNVDFAAGELCTVTVAAAQITDQDPVDPPDAMAGNHVFSFTTEVAPAVTGTTPVNGATQVAGNTNLSITFSEPVNVTGNWFQIVCTISGTRNVADTVVTGGPTTFTINPNTNFTAGETCTVSVVAAQVTDQDSNDPPDTMAANFVFAFTVEVVPSVTATTPTNGALQVGTTANLSVTFSEPVTVTGSWFTIACSVSGAHAATVTGGPTTFALNPDTDFVSGDVCTVTVLAAQVSDQDGAPDTMAANFVFSFTVDTAPGVTTTTPVNGATGVLPSATITVNFSESVNATTSAFGIVCGGTPQSFTLSASPATAFTLTPTAALPEGVVCTVTVVAVQVTDADAGDPPDTMLADAVFSFAIPPNAVNDARGVTGNVPIDTVITGFSVLSNDVGPGLAVTAFSPVSVQGGTVSVNAAGVFTYTPPVGYEGIDSFTYTITNAAGSDTAAVNISVSGMLWFVDNSAAACTTIAGGCGRLGRPFSSLAAFDAANGNGTVSGGDVIDPEAGDSIFIYTGAGAYLGPLTLEASQRVVGQGATSSLASLTGLTFALDSIALPSTGGVKPTITSGTTGITLAQNDQLHGLAFSNTGGAAVNGVANVGTLVMSDLVIANTSASGIVLTGGGTATLTGTANTLSTTTATALNVANTSIGGAGLTFRSIAVNGASRGIVLNTTGVAAGNGGLTVTGTGAAGSGGTIQNISVRGAELVNTKAVSLSNVNFVSANSTTDGGGAGVCDDLVIAGCNAAIYMSGVSGASFTNVHLSGTMVENGITGVNVSNFVFANGSITGAGDEANESGMEFQNLSGTSAITGSDISFSETNAVDVVNTGVNLTLSIANSTLRDSQTVSAGGAVNGNGEGGFQFRSFGAPTTNIDIANSQFLRLRTQGIQAIAEDSSVLNIDITGNTIDSGTDIGTGIDLNANDTGRINFNVIGNPTIHSNGGSAVNITTFLGAHGEGRVNDNTMQVDSIGSGLRFVAQETSQLTAEARNNTVTFGATNNSNAIDAQARFNTARLDLTLDANHTTVNTTSLVDINLTAGSSTAGESNIVCANVTDNVASSTGAAKSLRLRVSDLSNVTRLFLQGFTLNSEATWNGNGNTPVSAGNSEITVSLTGTAVAPSGATCQVPGNPMP
jgi:methionine-rich copper-binding protein CopC